MSAHDSRKRKEKLAEDEESKGFQRQVKDLTSRIERLASQEALKRGEIKPMENINTIEKGLTSTNQMILDGFKALTEKLDCKKNCKK